MASFAAVFMVLMFLAVAMRLIIVIFPEKPAADAGADEAAVYAAISSTYARLYPGTRVSNIEEIKKP